MKSIWKERWGNCHRCLSLRTLYNYQDKVSSLTHSILLCALEPMRKDFSVDIQKKDGLYIIYSEAPHATDTLKGVAVRSLIRTYSRGSKQYVCLDEERLFFPHLNDPSLDYYIINQWDRGMAVNSTPLLSSVMSKLISAAELN